jgi:hypothetical protein
MRARLFVGILVAAATGIVIAGIWLGATMPSGSSAAVQGKARSEPSGSAPAREEPAGEEADEGEEGDRDAGADELRLATPPLRISARPGAAAAVTASGFDAERVFSTGDDWEPTVVADPSSNWVYQATTRYGGPKACQSCSDPAIIVRASSDGGATYGPDRYICACKNVKAQNDPELAVSSNGTLYAAWLNDYNPGVVFSKSTDHGQTWSAPVAVSGKSLSFSDKPILLVSPSGQDIYIAFNSSDSYVVSSHNGGASFTRVKTNSDSLYWFAEGGAIAPDGSVYFSESAENQSATGQVKLAVLRSANGGSTWTTTFVDTSEQQPACTSAGCTSDFLGPQTSIAVDTAGRLVLAYTLGTTAGGPKKLYARTSTNGTTWSARTQVNALGDSGFPAIARGTAAGDFRLVWQDSRSGAAAWNTWFTRSTDGGATWAAAVRLSAATSGAPYKSAAGYAFPYGDYLGLSVAPGGVNHIIWGEGTSYAGPGGSWYTRGS